MSDLHQGALSPVQVPIVADGGGMIFETLKLRRLGSSRSSGREVDAGLFFHLVFFSKDLRSFKYGNCFFPKFGEHLSLNINCRPPCFHFIIVRTMDGLKVPFNCSPLQFLF